MELILAIYGKAVQVEPMTSRLKAPGTKPLKSFFKLLKPLVLYTQTLNLLETFLLSS